MFVYIHTPLEFYLDIKKSDICKKIYRIGKDIKMRYLRLRKINTSCSSFATLVVWLYVCMCVFSVVMCKGRNHETRKGTQGEKNVRKDTGRVTTHIL